MRGTIRDLEVRREDVGGKGRGVTWARGVMGTDT